MPRGGNNRETEEQVCRPALFCLTFPEIPAIMSDIII